MTIVRDRFTDKSVTGMLSIDGVLACYTLEPPKRPDKPCAIPTGTYQCRMMWSHRFDHVTPHVLNVPGFTAIEWHRGNYPADTEGCALVGKTRGDDCVWQSDEAFIALMAKLPAEFEVEYTEAVSA